MNPLKKEYAFLMISTMISRKVRYMKMQALTVIPNNHETETESEDSGAESDDISEQSFEITYYISS